jgi:hypothetical protein
VSEVVTRLRVVFVDDAPDSRVLLRLWLERHQRLILNTRDRGR